MSDQDFRSDGRQQLGFAEAVVTYIEPILTPFGFRSTGMSCYAVMYGSSTVSLEVVHDPLSYDIELVLRRTESPAECCTLGGILASRGEHRDFQASTPDRVSATVTEIADLLRRYGAEVLAGDSESYQRLVRETEARSHAYTKEVVQQPVRLAAEEAWKRRDYAKVISLYESLGTDLTALETKRLEYAKARAG